MSFKLKVIFAICVISIILIMCICISVPILIGFFYQIDDSVCRTDLCAKISIGMLKRMDTSVNPCDDFYQYSCGANGNATNLTSTVLSPSNALRQRIRDVMKNVLLDNSANYKNEDETKATKFYSSCIDTSGLKEKLGDIPLQELLKKVGGWSLSPRDSSTRIRSFQSLVEITHNEYGTGGLFSLSVVKNPLKASQRIITIEDITLTLPVVDYYLNPTHAPVINAYFQYIRWVALLLGGKDGNDLSSQIHKMIEFEKALAKITTPNIYPTSKFIKVYNVNDFQKLAPEISWLQLLNSAFSKMTTKKMRINEAQLILTYTSAYFIKMSKLLKEKLKTNEGKVLLQDYLVWRLIQPLIVHLSEIFLSARHILMEQIYGYGLDTACEETVNKYMGDAVGPMFTRAVYPTETKNSWLHAESMLSQFKSTLPSIFAQLKWMDEKTRILAVQKIEALTFMIGQDKNYDKHKQKYRNLVISETDYFANVIRAIQFHIQNNLDRLWEPVNEEKSYMSPTDSNAFADVAGNKIIIPVEQILLPLALQGESMSQEELSNFDKSQHLPTSVIFGTLGFIFGHEIMHGYDIDGFYHDFHNNYGLWATESTIKSLTTETNCFVNQISNLPPIDKMHGLKINGTKTLRENYADAGGIKITFSTYQTAKLDLNFDKTFPNINLTPNQLFFLAYAQTWCDTPPTKEELISASDDYHMPHPYRLLVPLLNLPEFSQTFNCPLGSRMNPSKKCIIW